jgi:hypothetical protein
VLVGLEASASALVGGCDARKPLATLPDDAGVTAPLDAAAAAHDDGSPPASGSADAGVRLGCQGREVVDNAPDGRLGIEAHIDPPIALTEEFLRFSVAEHVLGNNNPLHTLVGLGGTIQIPTEFFALSILMAKGWDVATRPGDVILYHPWNRVSDCRDPHGYIEVVSDVILDETGELLLLSASTVGLAPGGAIVFGVDLATVLGVDGEPGFGLRWIDVGCPELADGTRSVAIEEFDPRAPTRSLTVLPGERGEFVLGGRTYVLATSAALGPTGDTYCGFALFSLYQKGYLISP